MNKNIFRLVLILFSITSFSACELVDPMADEQYEKYIYMVGAESKVISFEIPFGDTQEAFVSISASGTQKVNKDVEVAIMENNDIVRWYNNKYMLDAPVKYRQLSSELINVPSWKTTLKAGEIYIRFPFNINTSTLHCDSLYSIGLQIESTSDYKISETGSEAIFTLALTNDYSGQYQLDAESVLLKEASLEDGTKEWQVNGNPTKISVSRNLTAISSNAVRFFHGTTKQTLAEYTSSSYNPGVDYFNAVKNSCVKFVHTGGNQFSVESWEDMNVVDGEVEYDSDNEKFIFWYDYMSGSNRYRIQGEFRK